MFFYFFANDQLPVAAVDMTETGVGKRLAQCRRERKFQQKELAERSTVAASAISRFESGHQRPSLETLCRLATVLDVSLDWLVGRTDAQFAHRAIPRAQAQEAGFSAKALVRTLLGEALEALDRADGADWGEAQSVGKS